MKAFIAAVLVLASSAASYAQPVSVEEAQARLREKASRAASQPSEQSDIARVIDGLRSQISALKQENADLKAEIKTLKSRQSTAPAKAANQDKIVVGMKKDDIVSICENRKWTYDKTVTSSLIGGKTVENEFWISRYAGYPSKLVLRDGIVTHVEY